MARLYRKSSENLTFERRSGGGKNEPERSGAFSCAAKTDLTLRLNNRRWHEAQNRAGTKIVVRGFLTGPNANVLLLLSDRGDADALVWEILERSSAKMREAGDLLAGSGARFVSFSIVEAEHDKSAGRFIEDDVRSAQLHGFPDRPGEDFANRGARSGQSGRCVEDELKVLHIERT